MTRRKHCRKDKNFLVNFRCRGEATLSVTPDGVPAPPKGELLAMPEKFLVAFDTLVTGLTACALSVKT